LILHKQQHEAFGNQVKKMTKEKKEKENVLIDLELVSVKNAYPLHYEKLIRKIIKAD
jgi:hypothetical protein